MLKLWSLIVFSKLLSHGLSHVCPVQITHRETLALLNELTGAVVTTKGHYLPPGRALPEGERSIYLLIEGATDQIVRDAKRECKRILEESTERAMRRDAAQGGRYQI